MSETLIKVEHVSKKFCRSLKRSLWYGMQDLYGRGQITFFPRPAVKKIVVRPLPDFTRRGGGAARWAQLSVITRTPI
jgi:hypothetical protein